MMFDPFDVWAKPAILNYEKIFVALVLTNKAATLRVKSRTDMPRSLRFFSLSV